MKSLLVLLIIGGLTACSPNESSTQSIGAARSEDGGIVVVAATETGSGGGDSVGVAAVSEPDFVKLLAYQYSGEEGSSPFRNSWYLERVLAEYGDDPEVFRSAIDGLVSVLEMSPINAALLAAEYFSEQTIKSSIDWDPALYAAFLMAQADDDWEAAGDNGLIARLVDAGLSWLDAFALVLSVRVEGDRSDAYDGELADLVMEYVESADSNAVVDLMNRTFGIASAGVLLAAIEAGFTLDELRFAGWKITAPQIVILDPVEVVETFVDLSTLDAMDLFVLATGYHNGEFRFDDDYRGYFSFVPRRGGADDTDEQRPLNALLTLVDAYWQANAPLSAEGVLAMAAAYSDDEELLDWALSHDADYLLSALPFARRAVLLGGDELKLVDAAHPLRDVIAYQNGDSRGGFARHSSLSRAETILEVVLGGESQLSIAEHAATLWSLSPSARASDLSRLVEYFGSSVLALVGPELIGVDQVLSTDDVDELTLIQARPDLFSSLDVRFLNVVRGSSNDVALAESIVAAVGFEETLGFVQRVPLSTHEIADFAEALAVSGMPAIQVANRLYDFNPIDDFAFSSDFGRILEGRQARGFGAHLLSQYALEDRQRAAMALIVGSRFGVDTRIYQAELISTGVFQGVGNIQVALWAVAHSANESEVLELIERLNPDRFINRQEVSRELGEARVFEPESRFAEISRQVGHVRAAEVVAADASRQELPLAYDWFIQHITPADVVYILASVDREYVHALVGDAVLPALDALSLWLRMGSADSRTELRSQRAVPLLQDIRRLGDVAGLDAPRMVDWLIADFDSHGWHGTSSELYENDQWAAIAVGGIGRAGPLLVDGYGLSVLEAYELLPDSLRPMRSDGVYLGQWVVRVFDRTFTDPVLRSIALPIWARHVLAQIKPPDNVSVDSLGDIAWLLRADNAIEAAALELRILIPSVDQAASWRWLDLGMNVHDFQRYRGDIRTRNPGFFAEFDASISKAEQDLRELDALLGATAPTAVDFGGWERHIIALQMILRAVDSAPGPSTQIVKLSPLASLAAQRLAQVDLWADPTRDAPPMNPAGAGESCHGKWISPTTGRVHWYRADKSLVIEHLDRVRGILDSGYERAIAGRRAFYAAAQYAAGQLPIDEMDEIDPLLRQSIDGNKQHFGDFGLLDHLELLDGAAKLPLHPESKDLLAFYSDAYRSLESYYNAVEQATWHAGASFDETDRFVEQVREYASNRGYPSVSFPDLSRPLSADYAVSNRTSWLIEVGDEWLSDDPEAINAAVRLWRASDPGTLELLSALVRARELLASEPRFVEENFQPCPDVGRGIGVLHYPPGADPEWRMDLPVGHPDLIRTDADGLLARAIGIAATLVPGGGYEPSDQSPFPQEMLLSFHTAPDGDADASIGWSNLPDTAHRAARSVRMTSNVLDGVVALGDSAVANYEGFSDLFAGDFEGFGRNGQRILTNVAMMGRVVVKFKLGISWKFQYASAKLRVLGTGFKLLGRETGIPPVVWLGEGLDIAGVLGWDVQNELQAEIDFAIHEAHGAIEHLIDGDPFPALALMEKGADVEGALTYCLTFISRPLAGPVSRAIGRAFGLGEGDTAAIRRAVERYAVLGGPVVVLADGLQEVGVPVDSAAEILRGTFSQENIVVAAIYAADLGPDIASAAVFAGVRTVAEFERAAQVTASTMRAFGYNAAETVAVIAGIDLGVNVDQEIVGALKSVGYGVNDARDALISFAGWTHDYADSIFGSGAGWAADAVDDVADFIGGLF